MQFIGFVVVVAMLVALLRNSDLTRKDIMATQDKIDELTADVASLTTVTESAIALIDGLADQIENAGDDEEELGAIVDTLRSSRDRLAAAVAAHTPADGENGADTTTEPAGEDTTAGGEGEDSVSG